MKIRLLRKGEVNGAASIVGKNYSREYELLARKELRDMFTKGGPRPVYFVAEEQGCVVGFAGYVQSWMDYNVYEVFWVNVAPEHKHRGIGTLLVTRLVREIRKRSNARLILLTADAKKNLPDYYARSFGFRTLETFGSGYHLMSLPAKR